MLTKYGYSTIGIAAIFSFILIVISVFTNNNYGKYALIIVALFIIVFTLNFFRDPDRKIPDKDNVIVSPADGKILIIKDVIDKRYVNEEAIQISIFMSPLNVHVNRIPIDGKVEYLKYIKGEYLVAYHDKADERNERSEIGILSKFGKVFYTQVAGMVARRIIYDLKLDDTVKMGNRFGMIKFGSRVDVIVPKKWNLKVKEGDITSAGETILFEIN
ncbi:MAG: phosphatidylserine decarboxylase family protein [Melioribacteraceae bacterium]|nr:phosphatidylserine decarboxylase family protein [Melioribacteraceae bacterium]